MVYPPPAANIKYTEEITPSYGFVIAANGTPTAASGMRLASQLREFERASPALLLKAMDDSKNLASAGTQKLGKASLPAVTYMDGGTKFTILFDPKTHLPAAIRTLDDDNIFGDANYDLVIPVPLHRERLRWRGFNQAAMLANAVARRIDRPLDLRTLVRVRPTPPQTRQNRVERVKNLRRAFAVRRPARLSSRRILLIDDVMTTGATADECARTLIAAGARRVDVLTLARAV